MSQESLNSPESLPPVPEITLVEGPDFYHYEEVYETIFKHLVEREIDPADVLLCGHAEKSSGDDRLTTFAMGFEEITKKLPYGDWTPFKYAEYEREDTQVVISVYDAKKLQDRQIEGAGDYEMIDGTPIRSALLLQAKIELQN